MADTCSFTGKETKHEIYAKFFNCVQCDTPGREIFTIMMCTFFLFIIIAMVMLFIDFIKKNQQSKPSMFNITLFYIPFTIMFYITNIVQSINHCYSQIGVIQWITWNLKVIIYGAGFQIFLNMLYYRLWFIFRATASRLSKRNIRCFIALNVFGFIDIFLILLNDGLALDFQLLSYILLLVGIICIILATFWISSLYIYKLWKIVQQREEYADDNRRGDVMHDEKLIRVLAKQTILAILCLSGTLLTLSMSAFNFFIPDDHDDWFWIKRTNAIFLAIDITTNVLLFLLGFQYLDKLYNKIFGCCDIKCRKCCAYLVLCSLGKHNRKVTHRSVKSDSADFTEETDTLKVNQNGATLTKQQRSHAYDEVLGVEDLERLPSRSAGSSVAKSLSTVSLNDGNDHDHLDEKEPLEMQYIRTKSSQATTVKVPTDKQLRTGAAMKMIQEDHVHIKVTKIKEEEEKVADDDDGELPSIPSKGFMDLPSIPHGSLSALPSIPKQHTLPGISPSRGVFPAIPRSLTEFPGARISATSSTARLSAGRLSSTPSLPGISPSRGVLPSLPKDEPRIFSGSKGLTTLPSIPSNKAFAQDKNVRKYMHANINESDSCGSESEEEEEKLPVLFIKGTDEEQDNEYSTLVQEDKKKKVFGFRPRKFVKKRRFPTNSTIDISEINSDTEITASDLVDIDAVVGSLTKKNVVVEFMKEDYV